jgi:hypothetical protein
MQVFKIFEKSVKIDVPFFKNNFLRSVLSRIIAPFFLFICFVSIAPREPFGFHSFLLGRVDNYFTVTESERKPEK